MTMKGLEYRDNRMKCELFYLEHPEFMDEPWRHVDPEIHVVCQFRAVNFKDAIEYTKNYNLQHSDQRYFWRHKHERGDYGLWHVDGVCSWGLSDVDNYFVNKIAKERVKLRELKKNLPSTFNALKSVKFQHDKKIILRKIARLRRLSACCVVRFLVKSCIAVSDWCGWYLKDKWVEKFKDWKWRRKKLSEWRKTGHSPDEWWSLELHMLDTLKFNVKKLIKDGVGLNMEFVNDAIMEKHGNEPGFDINKFYEKFYSCGTQTELEDRAVELQNQTYERICHLVDLYTFYYNSEVDDKDIYEHPELRTDDMREIYVEETYDMVDYKAMSEKGKECWNEIWDLVKRYGQQMGD